ncbi:MAG: C25 family cysteine peptidase, partial [candidate division WOR-3 bacterium]
MNFRVFVSVALSGLFFPAKPILAQPLGARYLIITADTFAPIIQPLADWKTQKGMLAKVVKLSEIGSTPAQIQGYIRSAYFSWPIPPEYVLLVGSPSRLPASRSKTDDGYGDMYGDYQVELSVGRFWDTTLANCSTMVSKNLTYELNPYASGDSNWFLKGATVVCEDAPPDSWYQYDSRTIRDQWLANGYLLVDSFFNTHQTPRPCSTNSESVRVAINDGRAFVTYRGMTSTRNWYAPFDRMSPNTLNNGSKLPIIVAGTCETITLNPGERFIGDSFVRAGTPLVHRGAIAYFAPANSATRVSHYRGVATRSFFNALFTQGIYRLGDAWRFAKRSQRDSLPANQARYEEWTLLGDPELNVWTGRPQPVSITCDTELLVGPSTFTIQVMKPGLPVCSALVCVRDTAGGYYWGTTDGTGTKVFALNLRRAGLAQVTVTGPNCLPWSCYLPVKNFDFGVTQILAPATTIDSGTTVLPQAVVRNLGSVTAACPVRFTINDGYVSDLTPVIPAGAETTLTFAPWTPLLRGDRVFKCSTRFFRECETSNDAVSGTVFVAVHDLGVSSILAPRDTIPAGPVTPRVLVHNFGNLREPSVLLFTINSNPPYVQTAVLMAGLPFGDTVISLAEWQAVAGAHLARCTTLMARDQRPMNDAQTQSVFVRGADVGVTAVLAPQGLLDTS